MNNKYLLFYLIFFVLLVSCGKNSIDKPAEKQSDTLFSSDSLWVATGNELLDSMLQISAVAPQDTNLARLYYEIGEMYEDNDFEQAKVYYLKLKELSQHLNWDEGYFLYASVFSNLLIREGLTDSALVILHEASQIALDENNEVNIANLMFSKGNVYFMKGWHETALSFYMEALAMYEKRADNQKIQQLYYMMAQLYLSTDAVDKAIEYGEKSVALNPENPPALAALAMAYSSAHQYEKAKKYYDEALYLALLQNNNYLAGLIYFHIANDALFAFDLPRAEKFAKKSLEINRQFGDAVFFTDLILLSKLEQVKGNYHKSEIYANEALEIALTLDALKEIRLCYMILSELSIAQGKYQENIHYWEESNLLEIALAKETMLNANEELEARYKFAKKEFEIENQRRIIATQKLQHRLLITGVSLCILALVFLLFIVRMRNKRNQELKEKNAILAEMNATKNKFFSIISHDLKNPAISIHDALKMLCHNADSWEPDFLNNYYCELLKSSEKQIELIYDLLDWSQVQTGRITFTPAPFFLPNLASDMALVCKMAQNKGVNFTISIPEDAIVTFDRNVLITVVRNLLTNAVKFTAAEGTVSLEVKEIKGIKGIKEIKGYADKEIKGCADKEIKGYADKEIKQYIISVNDDGVGMTPEQLHNLFRIDSAHSQRGTNGERGSGLGLIICKEFLEKNGSALHIESEPGKGSRFWFEI